MAAYGSRKSGLGLVLFQGTHHGSADGDLRHAMLQVLRLDGGRGAAADATAKEEVDEGALVSSQAASQALNKQV